MQMLLTHIPLGLEAIQQKVLRLVPGPVQRCDPHSSPSQKTAVAAGVVAAIVEVACTCNLESSSGRHFLAVRYSALEVGSVFLLLPVILFQ